MQIIAFRLMRQGYGSLAAQDGHIHFLLLINMRGGFTMMETIIVAVIIGILATLGLASYGRTVEKTRAGEAVAGLRLIRAGEKIFRGENAQYYPKTPPSPNTIPASDQATLDTNINGPLRLSIDYRNYDFNISGSNTTFIANMIRNSGPYSGGGIAINQNGCWNIIGAWPFGTPPDDCTF